MTSKKSKARQEQVLKKKLLVLDLDGTLVHMKTLLYNEHTKSLAGQKYDFGIGVGFRFADNLTQQLRMKG